MHVTTAFISIWKTKVVATLKFPIIANYSDVSDFKKWASRQEVCLMEPQALLRATRSYYNGQQQDYQYMYIYIYMDAGL